ncbi:hypothetical protein UT300019_06940 [Clostridium sp. CTA-19]
MKKFIKITIIFIITGLYLIFIHMPSMNDFIADGVKKKLQDTPLPSNTKFCDAVSKVGYLTGNGSGIQFFGAILIKSQLSLEELQEYYSKYKTGYDGYVVLEQKGSQIDSIEHIEVFFASLKNVKIFDGYYIVYSWDYERHPLIQFLSSPLRLVSEEGNSSITFS